MSLPTLLATLGMVFFGLTAVWLSFKEEHMKKTMKKQDEMRKRGIYELSVLRSLQERIGYSLDVERVIDTLTGSLKNLFPYSSVSSLILHEDKTVFKITIEEQVGTNFILQVKKSMLASLASLLNKPLPPHTEEVRTGLLVDDTNTNPLASFFHIPLIVNGNVVGLISICSTTPGLYKEEDMTILYKMTATASNALSKLREVINTEQEKLVAMITSLADGILLIDNTYNLTLINQAAKDFLGIAHVPNPSLFEVVPLLSKNGDFGARIKESLSESKTIAEKELHLGDKTVELTITPVLGPIENYEEPQNRSVRGVTVLLHDITLEKSLENLKEEFTNAVVHELRSPLTAIKAASEVLGDTPDLPTSAKRLSSIIDTQSQQLLAEISSLLDAAKLEAGHLTVWQKPSDLPSVVNDSLQLFQPEAAKKHIILESSVEESLPQAFIDTTRIGQVINNLISNSLKFTHENGHILVKIASIKNSQLPLSPTNPGILVSVSDDGIGIAPDKQKMLFNKFSQIHNPSFGKELASGTGLGLYIARGIIQSHGGTMTLQSAEGRGTTVFFTLPVAPQEPKKAISPNFQEVLARYTPKMIN